jgi:hypothetical protein
LNDLKKRYENTTIDYSYTACHDSISTGTLAEEGLMDYLPKDPAILVSSVNMLLRDEEFDTLESLCYNFGTEPEDIKEYLHGHGFVYSEKQKQFRPIGYDE